MRVTKKYLDSFLINHWFISNEFREEIYSTFIGEWETDICTEQNICENLRKMLDEYERANPPKEPQF